MPLFIYPYDLPDFLREDNNVQDKLIVMRDVFRDAINYLATNYDLFGPDIEAIQTELLRLNDNEANIASNLIKIEAAEIDILDLQTTVSLIQTTMPNQTSIDQLQNTVNDYYVLVDNHITNHPSGGGDPGVYYDFNLPPVEERYEGMTWFDEE